MIQLSAVYAIWLREFKVFLREKERVLSSFISPLLWLFVFGSGLGSSVSGSEFGGDNYQAYIFPGIVMMTVLFSSIFYGLYIIWDRKLDFLKEVLVAPAPRSSVFLGKSLGGVTDVMITALVLLVIGGIFILPMSLVTMLSVLVLLILLVFATTNIGLILGANLKSQEGFGLVMNIAVWPLFFFSGALFPVSNLPESLKILSAMDPITYAVDALRLVMLGAGEFPLYLDVAVMIAFAAVTTAFGVMSFGRMQQTK